MQTGTAIRTLTRAPNRLRNAHRQIPGSRRYNKSIINEAAFIWRHTMATYTPPPYFPQSSLSPPDEERYRKFKLAIVGLAFFLLLVVGAVVTAIIYLVKWFL